VKARLSEGSWSWSWEKDWVWGQGSLLATISPKEGLEQVVVDHQGSAALLVNRCGRRIAQLATNPWGLDVFDATQNPERHRYTGHLQHDLWRFFGATIAALRGKCMLRGSGLLSGLRAISPVLLCAALLQGLVGCAFIRRCPATCRHGEPLLSLTHVNVSGEALVCTLAIFADGALSIKSGTLRFCGQVPGEDLEPIRRLIRDPRFLEIAQNPSFREGPCCDQPVAYIKLGNTKFVVGLDQAPPLVWRLFAQLDALFAREFGDLYRFAAISLNYRP